MSRTFTLHGPFDGAQIVLQQFTGYEQLSSLFEFRALILCDRPSLAQQQLLAQEVSVEIEQAQGPARYLSGIVTQFKRLGRFEASPRYYQYELIIRPWLWLAKNASDYKIYQEKSVLEIFQEVFSAYPFAVEMRLTESYRRWNYCVQYDETDFGFLSRLMEQEGIYYWFEHSQGQHTLVLADDSAIHPSVPGQSSIAFYSPHSPSKHHEEHFFQWQAKRRIVPSRYTTDDYDLNKPQAHMDVVQFGLAPKTHGLDLEIYDPIGGYTEEQEGARYAKVRMQALELPRHSIKAMANARNLLPGHRFNLTRHPNETFNQAYMIVRAEYDFAEAGYATSNSTEAQLSCQVELIPADTQFRAPLITPLPKTTGPQTARVVGAAGESIWTDKYGRIKVQFHWDRYGQENEHSSCWIRVSNPWAGGGFGGLQIPRVNEEVIVDFIGGYPDRPIVVGRVYNQENMPPVNLPEEATVSGFQTRTKDGDSHMGNQMTFDDTPGEELLNMVAQKDMQTKVKNDARHTVLGNSNTNINAQHQWKYGGLLSKNVTAAATYQHENGHVLTIAGNNQDTVTQRQTREYVGPNQESTQGTESLSVTGEPYIHEYQQGIQTLLNAYRHDLVLGERYANYDANLNVNIGGNYSQEVLSGDTSLASPNLNFTAAQHYGIKSANTIDVFGSSVVQLQSGATMQTRAISIACDCTQYVMNNTTNLGIYLDSSTFAPTLMSTAGLKLSLKVNNEELVPSSMNVVGFQLGLDINKKHVELVKAELKGIELKTFSKKKKEYAFWVFV